RRCNVGHLLQLGELVEHQQKVVSRRILLGEELVEDQIDNEPDKWPELVPVTRGRRYFEVQRHRRFAINEGPYREIGTANGLLNDRVIVDRHRGDDGGLYAGAFSVGPVELALHGFGDVRVSRSRPSRHILPVARWSACPAWIV